MLFDFRVRSALLERDCKGTAFFRDMQENKEKKTHGARAGHTVGK